MCWLDEGLKVKDQGGDSGSLNLVLLKKYYTANADLALLRSSTALLKLLYSQVFTHKDTYELLLGLVSER